MESITLFFDSLILFLAILSCITVIVSLLSTAISYADAKRKDISMDFNFQGMFFTVVVPLVYLISLAISTKLML